MNVYILLGIIVFSLASAAEAGDLGSKDELMQLAQLKKTANILCIVIAERGHFNPMLHLCMDLAKRGWKVKLSSQKTNAPVIGEEYPTSADFLQFIPAGDQFFPGNQSEQLERRRKTELSRIADEMYAALDAYLGEEAESSRPDLIIGDVFTFAGPMLAEKYNISLIVNCPVLIGGITNPLTFMMVSEMNRGKARKSSFDWILEYADNFSEEQHIKSLDRQLVARLNKVRSKVGLSQIEASTDSYSNGLILVDSAIGFEYDLGFAPSIFHVGPLLPREVIHRTAFDPAAVPADLRLWLESRDKIVYFSMGSVALLPEFELFAIFSALKDLDAIIVLPKAQHTFAQKIDENNRWRLEAWAPQKHILAHEHVKLFISHCGMGGAQEGLLSGVPLLCIPQFGDQFVVSYRVRAHRVGEAYTPKVSRFNRSFDKEEFGNLFVEMWSNIESYQAAAKEMGRTLAAAGSVETTSLIVETALLRGTSYLLSLSTKSLHQFWTAVNTASLVAFVLILIIWLTFPQLKKALNSHVEERKRMKSS